MPPAHVSQMGLALVTGAVAARGACTRLSSGASQALSTSPLLDFTALWPFAGAFLLLGWLLDKSEQAVGTWLRLLTWAQPPTTSYHFLPQYVTVQGTCSMVPRGRNVGADCSPQWRKSLTYMNRYLPFSLKKSAGHSDMHHLWKRSFFLSRL